MSDSDAAPGKATRGAAAAEEDDQGSEEPDSKEVGDAGDVPEETFDGEDKSSDAVSVSKQGDEGETVGSEMGSKKGEEEDEKTEEKDAPDSTTTLKESSVEGDDQKKRFVAFCLLEKNQNGYLCCIGSFCGRKKKNWIRPGGKTVACLCLFPLVTTSPNHNTYLSLAPSNG